MRCVAWWITTLAAIVWDALFGIPVIIAVVWNVLWRAAEPDDAEDDRSCACEDLVPGDSPLRVRP